MHIIFIIAFFMILLSIPALLLYIALYILSKYYMTTLSLEYCGFLKFKNINFYLDTEYYFIYVHIDYFHIFLIWLKLRINIKGLKTTLTLKTNYSSLVKTKPINKYDFTDSFVIRKQDSSNKNYGILHEIKEKFNKILFEKYIKTFIIESEQENKTNNNNNNNNQNASKKENKHKFKIKNKNHQKIKLSLKDKLLRNFLAFFDLIIDDIEVNFKLSENEFFYRVSLNKVVVGVVKGLNVNKEIHFLLILNNFSVKEYVNIKSIKFRKIISKKFNTIKAKREEKLKKIKNNENMFEKNYECLFETYAEFLLLQSQEIFLNLKLSNGFTPQGFSSFNNTIELKIEVINTHVDLSSRAIDTIMKTLNELSKYKHYLEYKFSNDIKDMKITSDIINTQEIKFKIDCNEEVILNLTQNEIKKIKLKLENTSINILSDNHNYLYSNISLSSLKLKKSNLFCSSCDESKIKLIKTKLELSLDNMVISSSKKTKKILGIDKYDFIINKEVVYYYEMRESYIKTTINSDLPALDITMNTKDLDKYVELMVNIICSLEKIEAYDSRSFFQTKYIEDLHEETNCNILFDNIGMIVYDNKIQAELNNCSFLMKMDVIQNKSSKIVITFNPIYINAFRKYCSNYASNCIVKGFELTIDDDLKSAHIKIDIDDVIVLIYDDFMIDMIKFISDFLTYNLRYSAKRKYKMQIQKEEFKAFPQKTETTILNVKSCTIYDYVAIKDLFTLKFENFTFVIDDYLKLPQILIYHQNNSSIIKKKVKWLDLTSFSCKFFTDINQVNVEFGPIILDIYSFELIYPLITLFTYYNFFPWWVIYHMNYKYRIDEDYKLIYVVNFAKKEITSVKFEEVIVYINQNLIATCAFLQTNPEKLNVMRKNINNNNNINNINNTNNEIVTEYNPKLIIDKLKEIKTQQIKIKVKGFCINQKLFFEREVNKNFIPEIEEEEVSDEDDNNINNINNDKLKIKKKYYKANELQDYLSNNQGDLLDLESKVTKIYQKSSPYYNRLSRIANLTILFDKINLYMEGIKILNLNNFKVIQGETTIYDNFDINFLNSYSLSYKTHTIFYKEVKSHKVKNTYAEIYCNDMKLSLIDVKIIDKITLFIINLQKKIMAYPFRENALNELVDESPMEKKNLVNLYVENLETIVYSLDPISGELYNKLYLRINYVALGNEQDKNTNKTELTVYYLSFGFNLNVNSKSKTRDYPLIILPLLEINIDGNIYRFNIPRNYMSKLSELNSNNANNLNNENKNGKDANNNKKVKYRDLVNHYVGENILDNFILNTQSLTIFINYHYLKTFSKIFDNLWNRSDFIQKYFLTQNNNNNNIINNINLNTNEKSNEVSSIYDNSEFKRRRKKMHIYMEAKPNDLFSSQKKDKNNNINNENINNENKDDKEKDNKSKLLIKMISTVFDLKIIYLINYQDKYYSTFLYHPQIKKNGYFGYIIRLYSCILKYSNNNIDVDDISSITHGKLECELNLLTITSLNENNLNDEKYFLYDKNILDLNINYKNNDNFNTFMELPYAKTNKYKALNSLLFNINKQQIFEFFDNNLPISNEYYKELPFKFNETLIKMYDIQLKHDNMNEKELQETYIYLNEMKVTWNKINMDMVGILIYEEILPITNAILRKLSNEKEDNKIVVKNHNIDNNINPNENSINFFIKRQSSQASYFIKKEPKLEESEVSLSFIINNFQICIENEITNSKVLVSTRNEITFKINKVCFNEKEKNFTMELLIKNLIFFVPPSLPQLDIHEISWIGNPENNKYYLPQEKFSQIVELPNVFLEVKEIIENENNETINNDTENENNELQNNNNIINITEEIENEDDENNIKSTSTTNIKIDKLIGEFKKEYFRCFMNIIKVFIFSRGDSYAEEKMAIDAKDKDLKKYKLFEIKNKIKENLNSKNIQIQKLVKEIRFELKEVSMTLLKDEKETLKLLMKNLSGDQTVYEDSSSELVINIQNWKILDLQNPRNEILLSQQNSLSSNKIKNESQNSEINNFVPYYENKIEMLRFRMKDSYASIGTDSKWYVIQYLELGILPLYLNVTKTQCDFILEFFFDTDSSKNLTDAEYKKFIDELSDDEGQEQISKFKSKNSNSNNNENKPEEPFYFNNVKINNMKLNISFFFNHGSPWNFKKAKIKLYEFEKRDKFYSMSILISRFISHLKYMAITNLGNILSSFFFSPEEKSSEINEDTAQKKLKEEEDKHKKLLFGNLYNK